MQHLPETARQWALNTALHGCRHLVEDNRHWIEKIIWWIVQAVAFWGMVITILDVYEEYMQTPVVTSLSTNQYPAWLVPFPAIALCNINKISKRKLEKLAAEIYNGPEGNYTSLNNLISDLKNLGKMYDSDHSDFSGIQDLSHTLGNYERDFTEVLYRLAPSCDELLVRCRWKGEPQECSKLFRQIATVKGICCVFNDGNNGRRPETLYATGYRSGLQVLVNSQPDDYSYPAFPTFGTQALIFKPMDYPDTENGMIEYIIPRQREMFYTINTYSRFTSDELAGFSPQTKGCQLKLKETHNNCLSACVHAIVIELCRCLPHYVQNRSHAKVCDLTDIPCLSRNKDKFQSSGAFEKDEPHPCPHCLPACTDTWYDVQSSYGTIIAPQEESRFSHLEGLEVNENHSLLHFYYQTLDTTLYKQDVLYTRAQLVSNIGGICSLFNGFSFLSVVEIIYFLTIRWYLMDRLQKEEEAGQPETAISVRNSSIMDHQPMPYWRELGAQTPPVGSPLGHWPMRKTTNGKRTGHRSAVKSFLD